MNVNFEDIGATKKKLSVELPADVVEKEEKDMVGTLRGQARIKGFRKGKVPAAMIRRMFGSHIEQEVTQKLINEALPEALQQLDRSMVSSPVLEESHYTVGEPFRFSVTFDVKPEFEISGYEGLELTEEKVHVTGEMVDKRIEDLRKAYASTRSLETDRPLAAGDMAVIDYQAFVDGEPLEGGKNDGYQLEVGQGGFNADFEKGLEGMSKSETRVINVTFPEDHYNPKLAGQEVRFDVTLQDIKEKVIPEIDDEFVKDLGQELETVEQLRTKIEEDLAEVEKRRVRGDVEKQVQDKLLELVEFEVPTSMVDQESESMVSTTEFNLKRSGLTMEAMGMSQEKLLEDYRPQAERRVRLALIMEQIAKDHSIEAAEEDIEEKVMETAKELGQSPDVVRDIYNKNNMLDSLAETIRTEKTLKYLIDGATITSTEPPSEGDVEQSG